MKKVINIQLDRETYLFYKKIAKLTKLSMDDVMSVVLALYLMKRERK